MVGLLGVEFPGSQHVRKAGLAAASDSIVWTDAAKEAFVIISKGTDFQQRAVLRGPPPKVVWLRLGNCSTAEVADLLRSRLADLIAFEVP